MRVLDISSRAMLTQLSISQWQARKTDKRASAEILSRNDATRDSGRFHKSLIAKHALAGISSIATAARQAHVEMSLPWLQDGTRILPVDAFEKYTRTLSGFRDSFEQSVNEFCGNYPDYIEQARRDLGGLFNEDDYPPVRYIQRRFSWSVQTFPMPRASDFRVDLDSQVVSLIQSEMQNNIDAALHSATRDIAERLYSVVKVMSEKLAAYNPDLGKQGGVFRDSLVENVRDLVEILPSLNLTGNPQIAVMIDAARDKLTQHDAETLRDDAALRNETAIAAAAIADALAGFMD